MKEFSVCYDRFCLGNYTLVCDVSDTVQATADLGAFEMYVLGMWNDGLVVTMKAYDEVCGENQFVLLVPDGSEQLMSFSPGRGFVVHIGVAFVGTWGRSFCVGTWGQSLCQEIGTRGIGCLASI